MPGWAQRPNPCPIRTYHWGKPFDADKANDERTVGETSAVGCYSAGCSPYGCEEMSGNVWEWTRNLWGKDLLKPDFVYQYKTDNLKREDLDAGDETWRVVRGGLWGNDRLNARCASRLRSRPYSRGRYQDFCVVLRSGPVA